MSTNQIFLLIFSDKKRTINTEHLFGRLKAVENKSYIAIDLKSFYASAECVSRNLDPLKVNLVVADPTRTEKTICLAVSPTLKSYGISGRARLFEVVQRVREINAERRSRIPDGRFTGKSYVDEELKNDPTLELDFIIAPPRMGYYVNLSSKIYSIYLKYIAPEDIHVYSVDEVFMDVTNYLKTYNKTPGELAMCMILDVLRNTGITATAGIGTNLYLCKIAMDIWAKHIPADKNGVRIAELDESSYRRYLWNHTPLTDFWRIGKGYSKKLADHGLHTMGDIARCSVGKSGEYYSEDLLYKMFGVNAELLIDHAWGWEPCEIKDIKNYKAVSNSISSGQVLQEAYEYDKALLVLKEMTDLLTLDLVDKSLVTDQIVLTVCYDTENMKKGYSDIIAETDHYGRKMPKQAHGSINLGRFTSSGKLILKKTRELFENIADKRLSVRKIYVVANHVTDENSADTGVSEQLDILSAIQNAGKPVKDNKKNDEKEKKIQKTVIDIKKKFGKNAILKGMNLEKGATARERNRQIGGHKE